MKPAAFDYLAPRSLDEALARLAEHGDTAKLLAGGQSLMPVLNMRLATPAVLIDLNRLGELAGIRRLNGTLRIGALTRHRTVEWSAEVAERCPLLAAALPFVAHPQIRNRGTIGGNLAHADPASEIPAVVLALGGSLVVAGPQGPREIGAADFFLGPLTTALEPTEILTEVVLPVQPPGAGSAFVEFSRRHGDYALAAVAATLELAADGTIARAAIGLAGAGPTPTRVGAAEQALTGRTPGESAWREAAALAAETAEPESDVQAPADYRRQLVRVLTERALAQAAARARPASRS